MTLVRVHRVDDARRLRSQSESVHAHLTDHYFDDRHICEPGNCITNGTASIYNSIPGVALGTGLDRYVHGNAVRPSYWTNGKVIVHTYWWANNTTASRVVRIEITVRLTHPGDIVADTMATLATSYTLPTTAWEMFELDLVSASAAGYSHGNVGGHGDGILSLEIARIGSHGDDNYAQSIYFLGAKLQFLPVNFPSP